FKTPAGFTFGRLKKTAGLKLPVTVDVPQYINYSVDFPEKLNIMDGRHGMQLYGQIRFEDIERVSWPIKLDGVPGQSNDTPWNDNERELTLDATDGSNQKVTVIFPVNSAQETHFKFTTSIVAFHVSSHQYVPLRQEGWHLDRNTRTGKDQQNEWRA